MKTVIHIDGSHGEGGGQVLRTSLSLSVLTGHPVKITQIRAGRTPAGLKPQHLSAVRAAAALCSATVEGDHVGSQGLLFTPQTPARADRYTFDIGTAGAATLVLQTVLFPLARAEGNSEVTVIGGTYVPHAPVTEYLDEVYGSVMQDCGLDLILGSESAGFFPRGGGQLRAEILPTSDWEPVDLRERGKLQSLTAHIVTSQLPEHVAERGEAAVTRALKGLKKPEIERHHVSSLGPGAAVVLVAECKKGIAGFSSIGERGKPMERVADDACEAFMRWWRAGATCDEHLADQLVLPMSLVPEQSRWTTERITEHLRTVLWVVQQFLPIDYTLEQRADGTGLVTLTGVDLNTLS